MVPRALNSGENSQITNGATCKVKRGGRRRKKEKERKRKKEGSSPYFAHKSRHIIWRD
jgi:hypothetical protein